MKPKTLYISDLDGTLLRPDKKISDYTANVINSFVRRGGCFSYATARSAMTSTKVTEGFDAPFPVIVYNGAFIVNSVTKEVLSAEHFNSDEVRFVREQMIKHDFCPIVYSFLDDQEKFSFVDKYIYGDMKSFVDSRHDSRRREVFDFDELYDGNVFYFTCIADPKTLLPLNDVFRFDARYNCLYTKDIYTGAQWLELLPSKATKANAALHLKKMLKCDRIVSFGDHTNDLPLFAISDECYAVGNAIPELKAIATSVIESNKHDGVAKWIEKNA